MFQAFIYVYYKNFDKHRRSSRTGSFYAFCINRLNRKTQKLLIRGRGTSIVEHVMLQINKKALKIDCIYNIDMWF